MKKIFKATAIMGSSSVITILSNVIKYKFAAHILGTSGVGLIGILLSFLSLGSIIFILGIDNSSVREVAQAEDDTARALTIRSLLLASNFLAIFAFIVMMGFHTTLANLLFHDAGKINLIFWLAIGIAASILANIRNGILNGLSQFKVAARRNIISTGISTIFAILVLHYSYTYGVIAFVIATPLANYFANSVIVIKILKNFNVKERLRKNAVLRIIKKTVIFGVIFSISILCSSLMLFLVRIVIRNKLGIDDVGIFQASWIVGNSYLTVILSALSTEYYARISKIAHDKKELTRQVNEQIKAVLILGTPVILLVLIFAPWIIRILYSSAFNVSADILRWQMLGDIFKLVSWCIAFSLLARGAKYKFLFCEIVAAVFYFVGIWIFIPIYGIKVTGWIYPLWYLSYLMLIYSLAKKEYKFNVSFKTNETKLMQDPAI